MDKNVLLTKRIDPDVGEPVELPGVGTVIVRGLTRFELALSGKDTDDPAEIEANSVSLAMLDPKLTPAEVQEWMRGAPAGEVNRVTLKIRQLSGLTEGAQKSNVAEVRD